VFDFNLICYYNTINTSGCLISKIIIKYYECVPVLLSVIQYAMQMRRIGLYFFSNYLFNGTTFEKKY